MLANTLLVVEKPKTHITNFYETLSSKLRVQICMVCVVLEELGRRQHVSSYKVKASMNVFGIYFL